MLSFCPLGLNKSLPSEGTEAGLAVGEGVEIAVATTETGILLEKSHRSQPVLA